MRLTLLTVPAAIVLIAAPALADLETFEGPPGTVVAGELPQGGTAPGTYFSGFTITVTNAGGGPNTCAIFDTEAPTGGDVDLGTPNVSCGGPGIGTGGTCHTCGVAQDDGPNCVSLRKALIIAEDLDDANGDDVLDDPDDEGDGGTIRFDFAEGIVPVDITLLDIDNETASVSLSAHTLSIRVDATDLGDNSTQTIRLQGYGEFTSLEIVFSGSGAIAELEYEILLATEKESWGRVKARYDGR